MKIINEFKCIFPANSANEALARAAVSAFLIPADPTAQELADLRTVISEAVTNAIVHGYRGTQGDVTMVLRMLPERTIYIRVSDKGCGIPDVAIGFIRKRAHIRHSRERCASISGLYI